MMLLTLSHNNSIGFLSFMSNSLIKLQKYVTSWTTSNKAQYFASINDNTIDVWRLLNHAKSIDSSLYSILNIDL